MAPPRTVRREETRSCVQICVLEHLAAMQRQVVEHRRQIKPRENIALSWARGGDCMSFFWHICMPIHHSLVLKAAVSIVYGFYLALGCGAYLRTKKFLQGLSLCPQDDLTGFSPGRPSLISHSNLESAVDKGAVDMEICEEKRKYKLHSVNCARSSVVSEVLQQCATKQKDPGELMRRDCFNCTSILFLIIPVSVRNRKWRHYRRCRLTLFTKRICRVSTIYSLESLNEGRIILVFPHSGDSLDSLQSLKFLEHGPVQKATFPERPILPTGKSGNGEVGSALSATRFASPHLHHCWLP